MSDIAWITIVALICISTISVFKSIERVKEQTIVCEKTEGWSPPPIPNCNKEIWDRIREGCDDEGED